MKRASSLMIFFAFAAAPTATGCSSVPPEDAHSVRARIEPLHAEPASATQKQRTAVLAVLRGIQSDFGKTLTPRQVATRLNTQANSEEALGAWVFEPQGSLFQVYANAISMDSPIDWLRVTMSSELAVHLADLTPLFSHDYDVARGNAELVAVEFTANGRMHVMAELKNDRPAYISSAAVVSVQLRRPGYDPSVARLTEPATRP